MLAISPQTKSGFFENSSGPGRSPQIMKAPSITAVDADPGMPRVNSGTMAPAVAELLAASGPATPSIAPLPNRSGSRESCFSMP